MAKTNIIDAINGLEVGKTITVKKTSSGNVAHKVTLSTTQVKAEKQDYDYTTGGPELTNFGVQTAIGMLNDPTNKYNITSIAYNGFVVNDTESETFYGYDINLPVCTQIGAQAFGSDPSIGANGLNNATLPLVQTIGESTFRCCGLTSITLPSLTAIASEAFGWNQYLSSVYLPSVVYIDGTVNNTFMMCESLQRIEMNSMTVSDLMDSDYTNHLATILGEQNYDITVTVVCSDGTITASWNNGDMEWTFTY